MSVKNDGGGLMFVFVESIGASERVLHLRSEMNEWIDMLIIVTEDDFEKAKTVADQALEDWFEDDTDETVFDYVQNRLSSENVNAEIYIFKDNYDSDEFSN